MREHPNEEILRKFITNELPSEDARSVDRHLSICSECRDQADAVSARLALQLLDSWLRPSYDEAFERAADRTTECLANLLEESRNTEDLLAELLREPAPLRRRRIADGERFHSLKLCQLLLARSRDAWLFDPAASLETADLAVEVAQHLESGRYGSSLIEDSRALAWAYLANAFRITSDLWKAEQAVQQAWYHHLRAGEDAYTEAKLLVTTASLRETQARYDEAVQLSDRAINIYREAQDGQLEGSTLILKGLILEGQGRSHESISASRKGLDRIDPAKDPNLLTAGMHNLIGSLAGSGEPEKAREFLDRHRHLYRDLGEISLIRLCWLESHIFVVLEEFVRAEPLLQKARAFFLSRGMGIDVFLASLDLAGVYALSRQPRKVKEILGDVIPLGEALGLSKEAFLARTLFERASRS
jgi:tetratricopeptide (TPR) repeat protein